jgi:hypothetical protein
LVALWRRFFIAPRASTPKKKSPRVVARRLRLYLKEEDKDTVGA